MLVSVLKKSLENIESELEKQTDRGAAIIACAILDEFLTEAIENRLLMNKRVADRLFNYEKNGPLAHFAAKIDVGFAIGILKSEMWNDLHLIRRIRNHFAHRSEALKFSDTKISRLCSELLTAKSSLKDPRERYLKVCSGMSAVFAVYKSLNIKLSHVYKDPKIKEQHMEEFIKLFDRYVDEFDAKHRLTVG